MARKRKGYRTGYKTWHKNGLKSSKFDSYKVYIIKCIDQASGEEFYKIGKTYRTVSDRFDEYNGEVILPYDYDIVMEIVREDGYRISRIEKALHDKFKEQRHLQKKEFNGRSECFNLDELDIKEVDEKYNKPIKEKGL